MRAEAALAISPDAAPVDDEADVAARLEAALDRIAAVGKRSASVPALVQASAIESTAAAARLDILIATLADELAVGGHA